MTLAGKQKQVKPANKKKIEMKIKTSKRAKKMQKGVQKIPKKKDEDNYENISGK